MKEDIRSTNIMELLGQIHSDIAVIQTDVDWLKKMNSKDHDAINSHLKNLNGQVVKNTAFRHRGATYVAIFALVTPFILNYLLNL